MTNRHLKRCRTPLLLREMRRKTTGRHPLTPVEMASIQKTGRNKCWRGCGEKGTLSRCRWECKLVLLWRTVWRALRRLKIEPHTAQQSHSWAYTQKRGKQPAEGDLHAHVTAPLPHSQGVEAKGLSADRRMEKDDVAHTVEYYSVIKEMRSSHWKNTEESGGCYVS